MLIIDNSCSMFEVGNKECGNNALDSDPTYLRITGAALFAARMAFGQPSPQDRIGAISMGSQANVVYPLRSIIESRDALATAVDRPQPQGSTQVIAALRLAYTQLKQNPIGNKPAVVFLTDGVPDPAKGQSFADIEAVVKEDEQIPIYVLLLQNRRADARVPQEEVAKYSAYIRDWQNFQGRAGYVRVYVVPDNDRLVQAYYQVMADITARPDLEQVKTLKPGETKEFYVSRYAKRVYITVIHPDKQRRGKIQISDKSRNLLVVGTPGVEVFIGQDNWVEVYSAFGPRLAGQTDGNWRVTSVDATISFFVDAEGAYHFDWIAPKPVPGKLVGTWELNGPVRPDTNLKLQFRLVTDQDQPVTEKQNISGQVILPDGTQQSLNVPTSFAPDANGVYTLPLRLADYSSPKAPSWFQINLRSDDPKQIGAGSGSAIAVYRLRIQADPNVPLPSPSPMHTPTVVSTPVPLPTPTPTPCPWPAPVCAILPLLPVILGALAALLALLGTGYVILRIMRKPPEGFVVIVEDGEPKPPRSLKSRATGKVWGWWDLTVGPNGDLRIRPRSDASVGPGAEPSVPEQPGEQVTVTIPGMGSETIPVEATSTKRGKGKVREPSGPKRKPVTVLGRFINEEGTTKFVNLAGGGVTTLSDNTVQTVSFGNIQLQMCLDREKLI
jgi:hypothetical protein